MGVVLLDSDRNKSGGMNLRRNGTKVTLYSNETITYDMY